MLFRIYKAYVRGAHLTTQKNSPLFAMYFTGAQEGIFWAMLVMPVNLYLALEVFDNFKLFLPICAMTGFLIYLIGKLIKFDPKEYYPDRNKMDKNQIKKEVMIYNIISIIMGALCVAAVSIIVID